MLSESKHVSRLRRVVWKRLTEIDKSVYKACREAGLHPDAIYGPLRNDKVQFETVGKLLEFLEIPWAELDREDAEESEA